MPSRPSDALVRELERVFMARRKFGGTGSEWLTWAMNAHMPALVAKRFGTSRIVAFSTACVYPFVSTAGNGATEDVPPTAPSGEYANSCVARERMFQHFSHQFQTPGRLLRLSYAIDMRYGVLHDVAQKGLRRLSTWRWAMPTSSGKARPMTGRCAASRTHGRLLPPSRMPAIACAAAASLH